MFQRVFTGNEDVVGSDFDEKIGRLAAIGWRNALITLAALLFGLSAIFHDTLMAMVVMWMSNDTYAHGFLILPISLWLVWEHRQALSSTAPEPTAWPLLIMVPVGAFWLLANLVDVSVGEQYAFVSLLMLSVWGVLGTSIARCLAFPILFLLFAVPVGEGLVQPLINFTADFTVWALRLTGIPVYRDGTFFSIPSGDWSVVTACSGIRYLLASVTLGVLFSYLTYAKFHKRLIFIIFAIVVPIFANGVRAYTIVMIAHLSDMRLATGVDHIVYGWVFFGIVIFIMFAVGAIWRDPPQVTSACLTLPAAERTPWLVGILALSVGAAFSGLGWWVDRPLEGDRTRVTVASPKPTEHWQPTGPSWEWSPRLQGEDGSQTSHFLGQNGVVSVYIGVYRNQRPGSELVNHMNRMVAEKDRSWGEKEVMTRNVNIPGGPGSVTESRIASPVGRQLLVWHWYRVGAVHTSNPITAKLAEAVYRLTQGRRDGAIVAVATPIIGERDAAVSVLRDFVVSMAGSIGDAIDRSVGSIRR